MDIGNRITQIRKEKGISGKQLANTIDVSSAYVSAIEHGSTKLSVETLQRICTSMGVSLEFFFQEELSPTENELFTIIKNLSDEKQKDLLHLLAGMTETKYTAEK